LLVIVNKNFFSSRAINERKTRCRVVVDIIKEVTHLVTLNTSGGELVLVTCGTVNLLLARDETLRADRTLADHAAEALLVPLSGLIFHLLGT